LTTLVWGVDVRLTPVGNYRIDVYSDAGGHPNLLLGSSQVVMPDNVSGIVTFPFSSSPSLVNGATYWAVIVPLVPATNELQLLVANGGTSINSGNAASIAALASGQLGINYWLVNVNYTTV
jgi:hypothetical protein